MRAGRALLFFDDQYLDRRDNLDRRLGQPVPVPEGSYRDPDLDPSWGYPSVFFEPESVRWCCLYQAQLPRSYVLPKGNAMRHLPLIVESDDGVHWHPPDLTSAVPMEDRLRPHQVIPLSSVGEWGPCFYDDRADNPDERLKAFVSFRHGTVYLEPPGGPARLPRARCTCAATA